MSSLPRAEFVDKSTIDRVLRECLTLIPRLVEAHDAISRQPAVEGSVLQTDDALTEPYNASHMIHTCLGYAVDALRGVLNMLTVDDELMLPQFAHFPVLRQALEASSQAIWLMYPDDQRDRVVRNLWARESDAINDRRLTEAFAGRLGHETKSARSESARILREESKSRRARNVIFRKIAGSFSISAPEYSSQLRYRDIVEEAGTVTRIGGPAMLIDWLVISGLSHPSTSRMIATSLFEESDARGDGVIHLKATASASHSMFVLLHVLIAYLRADEIFREQKGLERNPTAKDRSHLFRTT